MEAGTAGIKIKWVGPVGEKVYKHSKFDTLDFYLCNCIIINVLPWNLPKWASCHLEIIKKLESGAKKKTPQYVKLEVWERNVVVVSG